MTEPKKPASTRRTTKSTTARKTTAAKKAAPAKTTKRAPKKTTTKAKPPSPAPRPSGRAGSNERATWDELRALGLLGTAHARAALEMAKWVDKADSPQGAAAAGRELRMQMAAARNAGNSLSPPTAGGDPDEDDDTPATPPGVPNLADMRARHDARRPG